MSNVHPGIDLALEQFESELQRGREPSIADFLARVQDECDFAHQRELAEELAVLDMEWRWRNHQTATNSREIRLVEDYVADLPEHISKPTIPTPRCDQNPKFRSHWPPERRSLSLGGTNRCRLRSHGHRTGVRHQLRRGCVLCRIEADRWLGPIDSASRVPTQVPGNHKTDIGDRKVAASRSSPRCVSSRRETSKHFG